MKQVHIVVLTHYRHKQYNSILKIHVFLHSNRTETQICFLVIYQWYFNAMLLHKIRHYILFGPFPILLVCRIKIWGWGVGDIYHSETLPFLSYFAWTENGFSTYENMLDMDEKKKSWDFKPEDLLHCDLSALRNGAARREYSVIPAHYSHSELIKHCS